MTGHREQLIRDHCLAPERVAEPVYGGRYRRLAPPIADREAAVPG